MNQLTTEHYRARLGLESNWRVTNVEFQPKLKAVDVRVDFCGRQMYGDTPIHFPDHSAARYSALDGDFISATNTVADKELCPPGPPGPLYRKSYLSRIGRIESRFPGSSKSVG